MKHLAGWGVILIVLAVCAEIISFFALTFVPQFGKFLYHPPEITRADYEAYMTERHPVLGWPGEEYLKILADAQGARTSPANEALGPDALPCVSVYGDSFAFSDEVENNEAWANVLTERLGCRVNNFGVGGFGADQAVLRLEQDLQAGRPLGDTLILTLYPDNLNRHMNQWRQLLTGQPLTFKPAFRVDAAGEVVLEPLFTGDYETFQKLTEDPAAYLPTEGYLPGAPGFRRKQRAGFPYSLTMANIVIEQIRSFRGFGNSGMSRFYNVPSFYDDPSGPSADKKAVTAHIVRHFVALCAAHEDKRCIFVITPDPELVLQQGETGTHDLRALLEPAAEGVLFLDATDMFTDLADICTHLTRPDDCGGHYNAAGNARLAEFVDAGLKIAAGN